MSWMTVVHPKAEAELNDIPRNEYNAVRHAIHKLEDLGPSLPFPHSSQVKNANRIRELRPRAGNSPWRAFYRRIDDTFVVAAIGPEAKLNRRGFDKAVAAAEARLKDLEDN